MQTFNELHIMVIFMPQPKSREGHIVLPLPLCMHVHPSHLAVLLSPQLLGYLMQGFETCNTAQTCIEHVHKGKRILTQVIIAELIRLVLAELSPFNNLHILAQYVVKLHGAVLVSATLPQVYRLDI